MDIVTYTKTIILPYLRARFDRGEEGAAMVEYGLLVALIAVVCVAAITLIGTALNGKFGDIVTSLK
ncbi:MAG TPA: Flp family type IVb pilin [Acidimicrobiales bacterium]